MLPVPGEGEDRLAFDVTENDFMTDFWKVNGLENEDFVAGGGWEGREAG